VQGHQRYNKIEIIPRRKKDVPIVKGELIRKKKIQGF